RRHTISKRDWSSDVCSSDLRPHGATEQFNASPSRIALSTAFALTTGSEPGKARQTGHTWLLGSAPNLVEQEQNIFDAVPSSMWRSEERRGGKEWRPGGRADD